MTVESTDTESKACNRTITLPNSQCSFPQSGTNWFAQPYMSTNMWHVCDGVSRLCTNKFCVFSKQWEERGEKRLKQHLLLLSPSPEIAQRREGKFCSETLAAAGQYEVFLLCRSCTFFNDYCSLIQMQTLRVTSSSM